MANTSLPNLTERTATANSDLIHVNSGGTDYKETKANFLSDVNSSITSLNNSLTNIATNVTGTTPSSSVDLKVAYPSGLSMSNCAIVNVEIYVSGIWRNLSAMANQSNYRVITSLRSDGIYVYPTGSDAYGVAFRITLLKV